MPQLKKLHSIVKTLCTSILIILMVDVPVYIHSYIKHIIIAFITTKTTRTVLKFVHICSVSQTRSKKQLFHKIIISIISCHMKKTCTIPRNLCLTDLLFYTSYKLFQCVHQIFVVCKLKATHRYKTNNFKANSTMFLS